MRFLVEYVTLMAVQLEEIISEFYFEGKFPGIATWIYFLIEQRYEMNMISCLIENRSVCLVLRGLKNFLMSRSIDVFETLRHVASCWCLQWVLC